MKNFDTTKQKYLEKGMKEKNIDYAIDAVKYKVNRELIIENLTSKYRNELTEVSNLLLDELYEANGGEFKYANRRGIFWGIFVLIAGIIVLMDYIFFVKWDPIGFYIFLIIVILIFGLLLIFTGIFTNHKKDAFGDLD